MNYGFRHFAQFQCQLIISANIATKFISTFFPPTAARAVINWLWRGRKLNKLIKYASLCAVSATFYQLLLCFCLSHQKGTHKIHSEGSELEANPKRSIMENEREILSVLISISLKCVWNSFCLCLPSPTTRAAVSNSKICFTSTQFSNESFCRKYLASKLNQSTVR